MYPIVLSSEFVWQILIFTFWCSFLPQSQHTQVRQNSICEPTKIWSDENIFVQPSKVELTKLLSVSSFSAFEAFAAPGSHQFYAESVGSVCVMSSCHHTWCIVVTLTIPHVPRCVSWQSYPGQHSPLIPDIGKYPSPRTLSPQYRGTQNTQISDIDKFGYRCVWWLRKNTICILNYVSVSVT